MCRYVYRATPFLTAIFQRKNTNKLETHVTTTTITMQLSDQLHWSWVCGWVQLPQKMHSKGLWHENGEAKARSWLTFTRECIYIHKCRYIAAYVRIFCAARTFLSNCRRPKQTLVGGQVQLVYQYVCIFADYMTLICCTNKQTKNGTKANANNSL